MIPVIYDNPKEKGLNIEFDLENGMSIKLFMTDEAAQEMINIMQNKLNGRL